MTRPYEKPVGWRKVVTLLREETTGIHPRLMALNAALSLLPRHHAKRLRARAFTFAGFRIGQDTTLASKLLINGGDTLFSNLTIGMDCVIEADCVFDLGERITIGDRVTLGPGVMILTSTHELDMREHRAGPVQLAPVQIGDGALLGARCVVLPGMKIGAGAIVMAGAVVTRDVPAHTRVSGTPATQIEVLKTHETTPA